MDPDETNPEDLTMPVTQPSSVMKNIALPIPGNAIPAHDVNVSMVQSVANLRKLAMM